LFIDKGTSLLSVDGGIPSLFYPLLLLLSLAHEAIPDLDCSSYAIRMGNQLCITSFLRPWSLFLDVIADTSRAFVGVLVKSLWAYSDTELVRSWFALPANLSNGPGESIELQGLCSKIFLAARQVYCISLVLRLSPPPPRCLFLFVLFSFLPRPHFQRIPFHVPFL
jgi:hypothetical protein